MLNLFNLLTYRIDISKPADVNVKSTEQFRHFNAAKKDLFLSLATPLLLWDFAFQNRFSFVADIRAIKALKSQKLQGLGGSKAGDESSEFSVRVGDISVSLSFDILSNNTDITRYIDIGEMQHCQIEKLWYITF